jgi:nitrite reductase (NO-forming)
MTAPTDARTEERYRGRAAESWMVIAFGVACFAAIFALIATGLSLRTSDDTSPIAAGGPAQVFQVELGDIHVSPSSLDVEAGRPVVLEVSNGGAMPHDLGIPGGAITRMLDPGESETLELGVLTEHTRLICTVPGHEAGGMVLDIFVQGAPTAAPTDSGGQVHAGDGASIDFNAAPAPEWRPFDPNLAPAPGGTNHEITLRATETVIEIAPGVTQELWTFDDQVPGPTLRGKVGDIFTVTLVNEGDIGHSIDFHASKVAWNDEMRTIGPGESLVYQFEAKHAGSFMYHCGTAPALHHIGNGMHGAIIIDPPDLAPVDHEFIFVQSEYYLGPDGEPGDLVKMQDDAWDAVTFNGYVNQYLHAPIRVEPGERVRAWVQNNGPSENSSFHIVGTVFDTVYKEGTYLLRPDARQGGSQAIDLQPSQGGFVEFTFDEAGLYPIVTHKFSNVGKGALGLFQAGDVEVGDDAGH